MRFKDFILRENKFYLGQKTGDLLTAIQSLGEDAPNLGNRSLIRATQGLVNQIRRILHGRWDDEDLKYLKTLQKIGVALCKAIDEKEDLSEIISSVQDELEDMIGKMEVPVNSVGSEGEASEQDNEDNQPLAGTDIEA